MSKQDTKQNAWVRAIQGRTTPPTEDMDIFDQSTQADLTLARHWRRAVQHKLDSEVQRTDSKRTRAQHLENFIRAHTAELSAEINGTQHSKHTQSPSIWQRLGNWFPQTSQGWALASICAVAVMALPILLPHFNQQHRTDYVSDGMQYRGDAASTQILPNADTQDSHFNMAHLEKTLEQQQVKCRTVTNHRQALSKRLECKVPKEKIAVTREMLKSFGLQLPDNGILIVIEKTT